MQISQKVCLSCRIDKPLNEFYSSKLGKFGTSSSCKLCCQKRAKEKYHANVELARAAQRIKLKNYRIRNRNKCLDYRRKYEKKNIKRIREVRNRYNNYRYRTDPLFNLRMKLSALMRQSLKGLRKESSTLKILGCSSREFLNYFKLKMTPDMTWKDVLAGEIHIDHIKPVSFFDLSDPEQQKQCFHYTNLQPLWRKDNLSKGAKV